MQSIKAAIRQKWFWACQNKPFWVHTGLIVLSVPFIFFRPALANGTPTDLPLRFWGMCLQLIGAFTVWIDLTKTAKDFGVQQLKFREWLRRFKAPPPIEGTLIVMEEGDTIRITGYVPTITQSGQSTEERLMRMERDVLALNVELSTARDEVKNQKRDLSANIEHRANKLNHEIKNLQGQLEEAFIGNYTALRVGAIWLVVGIVLSSVAVEITNLIHVRQLPKFW